MSDIVNPIRISYQAKHKGDWSLLVKVQMFPNPPRFKETPNLKVFQMT